jgi:hypothetical protein
MTHGIHDMAHALAGADSATLTRALVVSADADGVVIRAVGHDARTCDPLGTANLGSLSEGDEVFVWLPAHDEERGVVLGRIAVAAARPQPTEVPDELVIEAGRQLTLRVGEGSITIREDGKILIKGKDLVSHAQRMNRIKGGAVSIN